MQFLDIGVNIHIDNPGVHEFLKSYFTPFFDLQIGAVPNPLANIEVLEENFQIEESEFESEPILIDGSQGFLSMWGYPKKKSLSKDNDLFSVLLKPMNAIIEIDKINKIISLKNGDPQRLLVPLLRIIEDIVLIEVEKKGGVVLHSSGVVLNEKATLILGNKRAGKTTILCHLLKDFNSSKLTNDVSIIIKKDGIIKVYGWPSFFKIELGTIATVDNIAHFFPKGKVQLLKESKILWSGKEEKIPLYPEEGASKFETDLVPLGELETMIFPKFSFSNLKIEKWQDSQKLFKLLKEYLQGSFNMKHPNWHNFNSVEKNQIIENLKGMIDEIVKGASLYDLIWGPNLSQLLSEVNELNSYNKTLLRARIERQTFNDKWPSLPKNYGDKLNLEFNICAGGIVLNDKKEVAITDQAGTSWSLPKGHVEEGEDLLVAAKREIYEECGIKELIYKSKVGFYERTSLDNDGNEDPSEVKTIHLYLFYTTQENLQPLDPHNQRAIWVPIEKVSSYLTHRKDKYFFDSIIEKVQISS